MINTGLVSITFRKLSPKEIAALVAKAGLKGIEWGGDIHVPHGDLNAAKEVRKITADSGLEVAAYGSYYRVGSSESDGLTFGKVLDTALELKAPTIRVWAGDRGSDKADEAWWEKITNETLRISEILKGSGVTASFEYHGNTLTDTKESALRLMNSVGSDCIKSYWQPPVGLTTQLQAESLKLSIPWLSNVHVFSWKMHERLQLSDGTEAWKEFADIINKVEGDRYMLLEFVKNDDPEQFLADGQTLKRIVNEM